MFTGLVEQIGQIAALERRPDGVRLQLRCAAPWVEPPALGASICCSGMCLTAVELSDDGFAADVSNASLAVTTAGQWREGSAINLETSLTLSRPLGGHLEGWRLRCAWVGVGPSRDPGRLRTRWARCC